MFLGNVVIFLGQATRNNRLSIHSNIIHKNDILIGCQTEINVKFIFIVAYHSKRFYKSFYYFRNSYKCLTEQGVLTIIL